MFPYVLLVKRQTDNRAGPHHAIPALPDAGYTAPTLRLASSAGAPQRARADIGTRGFPAGPGSVNEGGSMYGGPSGYGYGGIGGSLHGDGARTAYGGPAGSVHGGQSPRLAPAGSVYGGHSPRLGPVGSAYGGNSPHLAPPAAPLSVIHSQGWAASSLPAPRRGPPPHLAQQDPQESVIAPHPHHLQSNQPHYHHRDADDDKRSDTSYYARPKNNRHRSESIGSRSEAASLKEPHHKRSSSFSHHTHQSTTPPPLQPHSYSPMSGSPLGRTPPPLVKSPLTPTGNARGREPKHTPSVDGRESRQNSPGPHLRVDKEDKQVPDDPKPYRHSNLRRDDWPKSKQGSVKGDEHDEQERRTPTNEYPHYFKSAHHLAAPDSDRDPPDREPHHPSQSHHHHHRDSPYLAVSDSEAVEPERERHHHHHHHHHRSGQYFTASDSESLQPDRERHHHHHKHRRPRSGSGLPLPVQSQQAPSAIPINPNIEHHRRTKSMQFAQPAEQLYQPPPIVGAPSEVYDDGASIAGSAMTFMDGPVQGRTSQYGLPKYPVQMKPDYRR